MRLSSCEHFGYEQSLSGLHLLELKVIILVYFMSDFTLEFEVALAQSLAWSWQPSLCLLTALKEGY